MLTPSPCSSLVEKVMQLRLRIKHLEGGSDPEYLRRVKELRDMYERRVFVAEVFKQYELDEANEEYEREKTLAVQKFEVKGLELKECLLNDLQDKKRAYDSYRHSMDLASGGSWMTNTILSFTFLLLFPAIDSFEPKNMVTRKLRRRHYDPLPTVEKRRRAAPLSSLVYILDESEMDEDIRMIFKVCTVHCTLAAHYIVCN